MGKKTISVGDVLEAMELDNVPLKRGGWFNGSSDTKIVSACILGQCAVNLGVTATGIMDVLEKAKLGSSSKIIAWNDSGKPYEVMVEEAKKLLDGKEAITIEARTEFIISQLKVPAT